VNVRDSLTDRRAHAALAAVAVAFIALHLPYLPRSLEDLDSINFALGLHRFDVAQHQPHPPGYPVYIVIGRAAQALMPTDAQALAAVSVVSGALGILAIAALYRRLDAHSESVWTIVATAIAVSSPLYWFTSIRPLSDACGLAAAVAVQAATLAAQTPTALTVAAFAAGLASGLRSQVFWLTVPLLLWCACRFSSARVQIVRVLVGYGAGVFLWLLPLVALSGGPMGYWRAVTSQGGEDLSGIRMLWTTPTPRVFAEVLYYAFVAPWATWPTAAIVVGFAAIGAVTLWRREPRTLAAVTVAFAPYFVFDALFQETFTVRYALPLVVPSAFLAVAGLRVLPAYPALLVSAGLVMFHAHVGGRSVAAFSRQTAPAFALLDEMAHASPSNGAPVLAPDRRESFDLRRPLVWLGGTAPRFERQLTAPPQHEWLEAVKYWNGGGRSPVWFVVDPNRAAIDLVQHGKPSEHRWTMPYPVLMSGTRPGDVDWYRVERPDWYVGEGWGLTAESAGVAARDRRGPEFGPIDAWVHRSAINGGSLVIGGRNFEPGEPRTIAFTIGHVWSTTIESRGGPFLEVVRLPARDLDAALPDYVKATVSVQPPSRVAVEQFDVSSSRGVLGFGDGWYEHELDPPTGRQWRWLSQRGEVRYVSGATPAVLHIEGESPHKYYARESHLKISIGDRILKDVAIADDFTLDVPVPDARQPATIVIETDQTHVPADSWWRRTGDRRRLGLRIYKCEIR
jgi:hypothetical protein